MKIGDSSDILLDALAVVAFLRQLQLEFCDR